MLPSPTRAAVLVGGNTLGVAAIGLIGAHRIDGLQGGCGNGGAMSPVRDRISPGPSRSSWSPSVHCRTDRKSRFAAWVGVRSTRRSCAQTAAYDPIWSASRGLLRRVSALTRSSEIPSLRGEAGTGPVETRSYLCSDPRHGVEQSQEGRYRGTRIGQHERQAGPKKFILLKTRRHRPCLLSLARRLHSTGSQETAAASGDPTNQRANTVESTNNKENEVENPRRDRS